jgi:signal transduction histidine kinase
LIINAIEATAAGGTITVASAYQADADGIEITISDTGEGIGEKDIDKIFDPFYTTKDSGNGLGLAITHGIIDQHSGTIDVDSKVGRGTTFTITLPLAASNG